MLALEPFAAVTGFADVDPVFEEIGEGTLGEWNCRLEISQPWFCGAW